MKKGVVYVWWLMLLGSILACEKEEQPVIVPESTIEITVKNPRGGAEPNLKVYLFEQPSTQEKGSHPDYALKTATTNSEGIAQFNLKDVTLSKPQEAVYITVLEEHLFYSFQVLGSAELSAKEGETISKELKITERSLKYKNGYIPLSISSELASREYKRWRDTQVVACNDGLRVRTDQLSETKVEGIGFGMLLAAYAKDKETFDGLWKFYNSKRTAEANNMMAWSVTCNEIKDPGSATDGDIDVAFGLIVASKHWGDTYLNAAKEIIQLLRDNLIMECNVNGQNALIVAPGYSNGAWGGCGMMDIMYHTPAFFRVFAAISGDDTWNRLADDTYITLNASANAETGLVPDWQKADGTPGPGGRAGHFGYDACRVPWRITLDYLWNGNSQAQEWSDKVAIWAKGVGPANIVDGYELDGTPIGSNGLNSAFLGGFSVATMVHSQAAVNHFSTQLSSLNDTYWFNLNTRCLYLFTLTGNFWNPLER